MESPTNNDPHTHPTSGNGASNNNSGSGHANGSNNPQNQQPQHQPQQQHIENPNPKHKHRSLSPSPRKVGKRRIIITEMDPLIGSFSEPEVIILSHGGGPVPSLTVTTGSGDFHHHPQNQSQNNSGNGNLSESHNTQAHHHAHAQHPPTPGENNNQGSSGSSLILGSEGQTPMAGGTEGQEGQSLKHLSASAPAIRNNNSSNNNNMVVRQSSDEITAAGASTTELILAPSSSKSRQKKFHRHFKTVSQEEKVLDYYSCALVGDILLQGYLYITENHFAFYSNVFGYVTKLLIPVSSVVRITKERTAKIIPNAVAVWTMNEKHVFASLISRETTYKLMFKIWNHSIDRDKIGVLKLKTKLIDEDNRGSGDLSVPDESSGESGSGNDSAIEPPSPPIVEKILHPHCKVSSGGSGGGSPIPGGSVTPIPSPTPISLPNLVGSGQFSTAAYQRTLLTHRTSLVSSGAAVQSSGSSGLQVAAPQAAANNNSSFSFFSFQNGPSLQLLATTLLVILFLSATILLSRISALQDKLTLAAGGVGGPLSRSPPAGLLHDSDQFYQDLLSWQNKLHSSSADEIHQYINVNLQQIIRVRQSLEALSLLFMSQGQPGTDPSKFTGSGSSGDSGSGSTSESAAAAANAGE